MHRWRLDQREAKLCHDWMALALATEFNRGTMDRMKHIALKCLGLAILGGLLALPALAQVPKRDLTVELRQVADARGIAVGTQAREPLLVPQQIQVRNGEKASLRLGQSMPMQWVKEVRSQSASLTASGVTASGSGGGVVNELTWMEAGQSLTVQPRWPGGKQAVVVELEVQSAAVEARIGAELPTQSRSRTATTLTVPLGEWVTIATTGGRPQSGVYGSDAEGEVRRLLQLRVSAQ
jgi:hypothetical protein